MHLRWEEALQSARGDVEVEVGSADDSALGGGFSGAPSYSTPAQRRPMSAQVYGSGRSRIQSYMTPQSLRLAHSRFQKAGLSKAEQRAHYAQMMHAEAMTKRGLKEIKARAAKATREVEETRHSTFKPAILQKSKRIVRSPEQKIHQRAAKINAVRTEKLKIAKVEQMNRELSECTFTPSTGMGKKSREMTEEMSLGFLERVDAALFLKRLKQLEAETRQAPKTVAQRDVLGKTVFDRLTKRGEIIQEKMAAQVGAMPTSGVPRGAWEMGLRGDKPDAEQAPPKLAQPHGAGYSVEEALYMDFLMREMKSEEREQLLRKEREEMSRSPKISATSARYAMNRAKRDIKRALEVELGAASAIDPEGVYRVLQSLNLLDREVNHAETSGRHSVRKKKQRATSDKLWKCLASLADLGESENEVPLDLFVDFLVTLEEKAVGVAASAVPETSSDLAAGDLEISSEIMAQIMKELLAFRRVNRSNHAVSREAATPGNFPRQDMVPMSPLSRTPGGNVTFVRDDLHKTNPYHKSESVEEWVRKERLRKIETEMSECTFSPRINTSPRNKQVEILKKKIVQRAGTEALPILDLPARGNSEGDEADQTCLVPPMGQRVPSPPSTGATPVSRPSFTPTPHKRTKRGRSQNSEAENGMTPPALAGTGPAPSRGAESVPSHIKLCIDVTMPGSNCSKRIDIAEGDDPTRLAEEFCREHGLGEQAVQTLRNSLQRKMVAHSLT